ncbi:MAG: hypothetical protein QF724_09235 [Planctomycetota bacterium]|jgi:hypothetical protein|nr:hypothetical protein [Planctomycetota bacterium]MDP6519206.1 hypothetical protein [Planctomycetota bacterium]MDP6839105.1 hypothetical protein [Planctomycetota bacterium]MDP6954936.1 hypothetical protein [Planctomycetota bacterium]
MANQGKSLGILLLLCLWGAAACGGDHGPGEPNGVLTGTVQDVHTRSALGGVMVEFAGQSTRSDRHGRFRLEGLELESGGLLRGSLNDGRAGSLVLRAGAGDGSGTLEVLLTLE